MGSYDAAQICLNGHVINGSHTQFPEFSKDYCSSCGAKTITSCPNCNRNIQGDYIGGFSSMQSAPAYCHLCGQPYPWTKEKLQATQELLALESSLTTEELEYFNNNLNSILIDTPKTTLVATKLKLAMKKTSSVVTSALRDILVDIASETAKKIIFPQ